MLLVLLVLNGIALKQQFNELINGKIQTNRDQKSNLFFHNDIINNEFNEEFNSNLLKIDKKSYKNIDIFYIGYIKIGDCENIYSVNPLYLIIGRVDGHTEENNEINI